jgi:hypothetical protein
MPISLIYRSRKEVQDARRLLTLRFFSRCPMIVVAQSKTCVLQQSVEVIVGEYWASSCFEILAKLIVRHCEDFGQGSAGPHRLLHQNRVTHHSQQLLPLRCSRNSLTKFPENGVIGDYGPLRSEFADNVTFGELGPWELARAISNPGAKRKRPWIAQACSALWGAPKWARRRRHSPRKAYDSKPRM